MNLKKLTSGIVFSILVFTLCSCGGNNGKTEKETASPEASTMEVAIGGMTCTGCEQTIQTNIGKLEGVNSVRASFTTGVALVEYIPGKVDSTKIKDAITRSGYTVKKVISPLAEEPAK